MELLYLYAFLAVVGLCLLTYILIVDAKERKQKTTESAEK